MNKKVTKRCMESRKEERNGTRGKKQKKYYNKKEKDVNFNKLLNEREKLFQRLLHLDKKARLLFIFMIQLWVQDH